MLEALGMAIKKIAFCHALSSLMEVLSCIGFA